MRGVAIALAAVLSLPGAAHAATAFGSVTAKDCAGGAVPNASLRDKLFSASNLTFSSDLAAAFAQNRLGERAQAAVADCLDGDCKPGEQKLADLYEAARPLSDPELLAPEGFVPIVDPAAAPPRRERPVHFLNGDWNWISLKCAGGPPPAGPPPQPATPPQPVGPATSPPAFVIAKSEEDAGKPKMGKRGFAGLGYSADHLSGDSTYDVDLFAGYAAPIRDGSAEIEPFVSIQYHSGKEVDDFAVGTALTWFPPGDRHMLQLKGAWESDHVLESSVWRADLGWTPLLFGGCERRNIPGKRFASCTATLAADYLDVRDAGAKAELLDLKSAARAGIDLNLTLGRTMGDDLGFLVFTAGYQLRETLSGDDADADMGLLSLGYVPGSASHFKLSLDYTNGRDLTSLETQEKTVLTFGYRR